MKRISYGKEISKKYSNPTCPHCGIDRGKFHKYGCLLEQCPKCGSEVINCACMVLSVEDSQSLIQSIKEGMDHNVAFTLEDHSPHLHGSYKERAAKIWIIENFPPAIENDEWVM